MSDVLIKGAKMPKECEYCMFAGFGGAENEYYVCMLNGKWKDRNRDGRMESCPLVEIPPHGRLIDADKLKDKINIAFLSEIGKVIDDVPAVIESEEQENDV